MQSKIKGIYEANKQGQFKFHVAFTKQLHTVDTHSPVELLEGAEGNHGAHTLTGWSEGGVQEYITNTGHMDHAVVVQVRGERHSESTTHTHKQKDLSLTQLHTHNLSKMW